MTTTHRLVPFAALTVLLLAAAHTAHAQPPVPHADVEIDPTAYVLEGYSLHVGLGWKQLRVDLGTFAIAVPSAIQTNEAFDVSLQGAGVKLQYFPFAEQRHAFVGVDMIVGRQLVERVGTTMASRDLQVSLGVAAGWRFPIGKQIYATPWIGVTYGSKIDDVHLAGSTYETKRITVFPAVHLGYRFR
ncbi:MAG: hypothetical protein JWP01_1251 [Myxococcales bacterium]|nr:hypothetical protein [Myxococcales bacterium]